MGTACRRTSKNCKLLAADEAPWPPTSPICPGDGLDREWTALFPLESWGRNIISSCGERFRLMGVNWYGASDEKHVVGGLDVQNPDVICASVRSLGFTVVRLPFSNEMLRSSVSGGIDFTKNPNLLGLSALEVFDEVVRALGRNRVAVVINNHTTFGKFCAQPGKDSLWFDSDGWLSEQVWLDDWVMIARRYAKCPHVVGFDLRNEIRPRGLSLPYFERGISSEQPTGKLNWARAAATAADKILHVNPKALLVVERIVWPQEGLASYVSNPGPLLPRFQRNLVLGVHMYAWSGPGRFIPKWAVPRAVHCLLGSLGIIAQQNFGDFTSDQLDAVCREHWGDILEANVCPVWISEFGADLGSHEEMMWLRRFVAILAKFDVDWAYWPLNVGPKPGTGSQSGIGAGDEAYGMLGSDWKPKPSGDERLELLAKIGLLPVQAPTSETNGALRTECTREFKTFCQHRHARVGSCIAMP
eukprot:TRINITY_DN20027_c0_g1_i1.p1 TRINITY_DN20027_c0_g1~~TRINITY_DN20027_c0_g1_i1.p1  ORF type:complete len:487 (-),score=50.25 TRINITY_DN20027_c0_g1_i1:196-1611(-)